MSKKATIGSTIVLDGEKEFKDALKGINSELRVQDSEMKLVAAQYDKNDKSMQAVTARSKILKEEIRLKTQKISTLEKALDNAKKEYGENSKQAQEWQKSLNSAKADLIKTTKALDDNQKSMAKLTDIVKGSQKELTALGATVGAIIIGLGKMTIDTSKTADDLLTLSSITGITTDELQKMRYAEELLDVSQNTITDSMTKLTRNMDAARNGTKAQEEAFRKLRVQYKNGKELRDVNEVFYDAIDALEKVKNETERDALAMQIFGKSAKELNPLIEQGSQRLRELGVEAEQMGYIMSKDTLDSFGALDDAMQRFNKQAETTKNSLAVILLPMLTSFLETIAKIPPETLRTIIVITAVVVVIIQLAKAFKGIKTAMDVFGVGLKTLNPTVMQTVFMVISLVAALTALLALFAKLKGIDVESTMGSVKNSISGMRQQALQNSYVEMGRIPAYARGTNYHPGGLALVGENGPEIVELPKRSKVYPNGTVPSGGDNYYITIDAKNVREFNDVVNMAQRAKQERRAR